MRRWIARRYGLRIMKWLYPPDPNRPTYEYVSKERQLMAVNTAGQTARPTPAYSNAQHAAMSRNRSPQSGGDIGGPSRFLAGKGIPTSGGRADDRQGTVDHTHDQGSKRLYLGKAFENAQHVKFTPVKGNSEGRAEIMAKTESSAVKKAAKGRLARTNEAKGKISAKATTPLFRHPVHPTFGPVMAGSEGNING